MNVFLVGATGAVGKALVKELARNEQIQNVTLIGRRKLQLPPPPPPPQKQHKTNPSTSTPPEANNYTKFEQKIVDFDQLQEKHAPDFQGYDVGFCSLGTTRGKAGKAGFYKVDHDYIVGTAKLAKAGGCKHFQLVSVLGAKPNSCMYYSKVKGQVEEEVKGLGFDRLTIWQPLFLLVKREEFRCAEALVQCILGAVDKRRCWSVKVPLMAMVMVDECFKTPKKGSVEVVKHREILRKGIGA